MLCNVELGLSILLWLLQGLTMLTPLEEHDDVYVKIYHTWQTKIRNTLLHGKSSPTVIILNSSNLFTSGEDLFVCPKTRPITAGGANRQQFRRGARRMDCDARSVQKRKRHLR